MIAFFLRLSACFVAMSLVVVAPVAPASAEQSADVSGPRFGPPQIVVDYVDDVDESGRITHDTHDDHDTHGVHDTLDWHNTGDQSDTGDPAGPAVAGNLTGNLASDGITISYSTTDPPPSFAKAAIADSIESWNATLSTDGAPVVVEFAWTSLPTGVLGFASTRLGSGGGLPPGHSYPAALANVLLGQDLIDGPEIFVFINSNLHSEGRWHYEASAPSSGTFDLRTVVSHEVGHGLGFVSSADDSNGPVAFDSPPSIYDAQGLYQGQPVIEAPNVDAALTSGDVQIKTSDTQLASLHTPPTWKNGSSFSHFALSTGSLMEPSLNAGTTRRTVDSPTAGVLQRMGWPVALEVSGPPTVTSRALDGQIERVYMAHLQRRPDSAGFSFWINQRASGFPLQSMIAEFQSSPEFVRIYGSLDNPQFVTLIYNNVLGRDPDSNGLAHWTGMLDRGLSRAAVSEGFIESAEFVRLTGTDAPYAVPEGPIRRLYLAFFGREGAASDVAYWSGQNSTGTPLIAIADLFSTSTEFNTKYGTLSDAQFVNLVYLSVLGRDADPAGFDFWMAQLDAGTSRGEMMLEFSQSLEFVKSTGTLP